jgi:hypothetical protein
MSESDNLDASEAPAPGPPSPAESLGSDPHDLRRVLAATGASAYLVAQRAQVAENLQELVAASEQAGHGIFMDCLPLVYGGRMSPRDLVAICQGFQGTSHGPTVIERLLDDFGIRGTIDRGPSLVGLELDDDDIGHIPTDRLLELIEAPLLTQGLDMDEASLLFGKDYVQQEEVEHDSVRHTWIYTRPGLSETLVLELRFEEGLLVGWKDHVGKGRAILGGHPRLESSAEIPHFVGGFHLAAMATCIALMKRTHATEPSIDAFIDQATVEIRANSVSWPGPELQTLTAIGDRYIHNRIRTDEAPARLEHYADRFASYDPESHIVPHEEFIEAALRVLRRVGGLERVSTVPAVVYWVALTLLVLTSLGFLILRSQIKAADAWPNLPIEQEAPSLTDPSTPGAP